MKHSFIISSTILFFSLQASQNNPLYTYESLSEEDTLSLTDSFSFESKSPILFDSLYPQESLEHMLTSSDETISTYSDDPIYLKKIFLESIITQIKNTDYHLDLFTKEENSGALRDLLQSSLQKENIDYADQCIINQAYRRIVDEYNKSVSECYEYMSNNIVPWKNKPKTSDAIINIEKNLYIENIINALNEIIENSLQKFNTQIQNYYKNKTDIAHLRRIKIREELDLYLYQ